MNCSVSAGPTIETPGDLASGPWMNALRMPSRFSSPVAVALPMPCSESISDRSGRWMSCVSMVIVGPLASFPRLPDRRIGSLHERGTLDRAMRITRVETLQTPTYPNLLWLQVHTDDGLIGLGE